MSSHLVVLTAVLALLPACGPKRDADSPRTTEGLHTMWSRLLECPTPAACLEAVERPRYIMQADAERMAQRLASFGEPALPLLANAAEDWDRPRRREVAERALLAVPETTLAYARHHDDEQGFQLLVRVALETPLLKDAYPLLVKRLPHHREWLYGYLRSGAPDARRNPGLAVVRLLGKALDSEVEPLGKLIEAQGQIEWELALNCVIALGAIRSPRATPWLVRALQIPSWRVQSAALQSIAELGSGAREAQPALLRVATRHWSQRVRWRAVTAMRFVRESDDYDPLAPALKAVASGKTYLDYLASTEAHSDPVSQAFAAIPANDSAERENTPVCAWDRPTSAPVTVTWHKAKLVLPPLDSAEARARRSHVLPRVPPTTLDLLGIGFEVPVREALRDARRVGDTTWLAACAGEFGGGLLELTSTGKLVVRRKGCFLGLRQVRGETWAFEGSRHLEEGYGRLWRVDRRQPARVVPVVDLPGEPQAARVTSSEVLVATNLGDVAVTRSGTVTPLDCEPF